MALFSKSVSSLQTKSRDILNVFTRTVEQLKAVNSEAQALSAKKTEERNNLDKEIVELSEVQSSNERIVSKIEKILE